MNMHKYWHFYDAPFIPDGTKTAPPESVNAKTEIAILSKALKASDTSDDVRSYDLVWLEHLVGDVHQPLHCINRFDAKEKDLKGGEYGGNAVALCATPKCRAELHMLWDDFPGTKDDPAEAVKTATTLDDPDRDSAKVTDVAVWLSESYDAATTAAYVDPIGLAMVRLKRTTTIEPMAERYRLSASPWRAHVWRC
jgi:hypothetical protein